MSWNPMNPKAEDKKQLIKEAQRRGITYLDALKEWKANVAMKVKGTRADERKQEAAARHAEGIRKAHEAKLLKEKKMQEALQELADREIPWNSPAPIPEEMKVPPFLKLRIYYLFKKIPMEESIHAIEVMHAKAMEDPEEFAKNYGKELTRLILQL